MKKQVGALTHIYTQLQRCGLPADRCLAEFSFDLSFLSLVSNVRSCALATSYYIGTNNNFCQISSSTHWIDSSNDSKISYHIYIYIYRKFENPIIQTHDPITSTQQAYMSVCYCNNPYQILLQWSLLVTSKNISKMSVNAYETENTGGSRRVTI